MSWWLLVLIIVAVPAWILIDANFIGMANGQRGWARLKLDAMLRAKQMEPSDYDQDALNKIVNAAVLRAERESSTRLWPMRAMRKMILENLQQSLGFISDAEAGRITGYQIRSADLIIPQKVHNFTKGAN